MKIVRGNIDAKGIVEVVCGECGEYHYIKAGQYKNSRHQIMAHLSCGHDQIIAVNFRKSKRKATPLLNGYFSKAGINLNSLKNNKLKCLIANISPYGMAFFPSSTQDKLGVGDQIHISFTLNDDQQTQINSVVEICHINKNDCLGAKFCKMNHSSKSPS